MNIFVLGPDGSDKSLLVKNFSSYLVSEGYEVRVVNLDPGVLNPGYKPDFDVRSWFTVENIMREKNLGPNGAILEAMDRLTKMKLPTFNDVDCVIFDTPGQLEPFLFRETGRTIVNAFPDRCCLFLGDLPALTGFGFEELLIILYEIKCACGDNVKLLYNLVGRKCYFFLE